MTDLSRRLLLLFLIAGLAVWRPIGVVFGADPSGGQGRHGSGVSTASVDVRPIEDPQTLEVIRTVQARVEALRGIQLGHPIESRYLDSAALREILKKAFEKDFPPKRRQALEKMLKSLRIVPDDLDLFKMLESLYDEQIGGLYDDETKRLYVRENYDIADSQIAQVILAHEICHALQDAHYGFAAMGFKDKENDDRVSAVAAIAEGDATLLMNEYAQRHATAGMMKEIPDALFMDQSALDATPHFFKQQLLFPYLQGEILMHEVLARQKNGREWLFQNPPTTSEQVIHPEKLLGTREEPLSLALLATPDTEVEPILPEGMRRPMPPDQFERLEINRMGELGIRTLFEERLGAGIAWDAAVGWGADAYAIYAGAGGVHWFCWETAWDTDEDAVQFTGAWITLWRSFAGDRSLGDLALDRQTWKSGAWTVETERRANRVVTVWHDIGKQ